ncbi:MAG: DUF4129 domain-containing protein [Polyangiaceae bacterium]|nr:DUF4129 domain-containing protein [Polyangiaceae bacterium]MCW5789574.1 DUF4129 domain-containing protein [Polyangiaceae bacterium]
MILRALAVLVSLALWVLAPAALAQAPSWQPAPDAWADDDEDDEEPFQADLDRQRHVQAEKAEVEGDLALVLDSRYRFCHDLESRVLEGDAALCDLKAIAKPRCPGFAEACEKPFVESLSQRRRAERKESPKLELPKLSAGLGVVAKVLFWGMLLLLLVFLVWAIVKGARSREAASVSEADEPLADDPEEAASAARRRRVETDVERLLRRAHAEAAQGRFEQALADAYAALLRHLEGNGYIDMHPSRTNGEYARGLREHPALRAAVEHSAREIEAVQFGARAPSAERFRAVVERVTAVVGRGAALVLALVLALSTTACDELTRGPAPGPGDEAGGFSLLARLLAQRGAVVKHHEGEGSLDLEAGLGVVVVHGQADLPAAEWTRLREFVDEGGTLIIALDTDQSFTSEVTRGPSARCESLRAAPAYFDYQGLILTAPGPGWLMAPNDHWPVLQCAAKDGTVWSHVVASTVGEGSVVILPGSGLLTNASMVSGDHAFVLLELLFGQPASVLFVDAEEQVGEDSPLMAVAQGRLGPILLQLFALMALFYWLRGKHFGRPRALEVTRRRAFSEHVEALGTQYHKAGASRLALGMYAGWAIERLRERVLPGKGGSLSALAQAVAARSGRAEGDVLRVLVEGDSAHKALTAPGEPVEDHRIMRELDGLLSEVGGSVGR